MTKGMRSENRSLIFGLIVMSLTVLGGGWALSSLGTTPSTELKKEFSITQSDWDILQGHIESLEQRASYLESVVYDLLDHNPEVFIDWLSEDLDAVTMGDQPRGSFSDFFVPTIHRLTENGDHDEEANILLDRLVALARGGQVL